MNERAVAPSLFISPFGLAGAGGRPAPAEEHRALEQSAQEDPAYEGMINPFRVEQEGAQEDSASALRCPSPPTPCTQLPVPQTLNITERDDEMIRRVEACLPGSAPPKSPSVTPSASTVGERMMKNSRKSKGQVNPKADDTAQTEDNSESSGGKDGWGVLSRRFAVSSALSSLNNELKTFGAKPQEAAIEREKVQMIRPRQRCMIMPGSSIYVKYSWLNMVLLLYCAFSIPVRVSFDFQLSRPMEIFEFCIDLFFMADIFVNFATGYVIAEDGEEPVIETDHRKVAVHYVRTWFAIDIISALPINFLLGHETIGGANRLPRLLRIPKLIRMVRLLRLIRLVKLLRATSVFDTLSTAGVHPRLSRAIKLVLLTLVGSHVVACCWHLLHTLATADDPGQQSWWSTYCQTALPEPATLCSASLQTRYILSLYWAVTTLTTIGYGDILPISDAEYIYTIVCMYVGVSFYAYIAANVATVLASLDTKCQIQEQKMDKLNEFLKATKMPTPLRRRLRKYFSLYWTQLGTLMPYDTRKLIGDINLPSLRAEVTHCLYDDQLSRVPFLKNRDTNFVTSVVTKLVPLHVLSGELLAREGELGSHMFFLWNGKIECVYRTQILHYMVQGSYFGDVAVLLLKRHVVSFRAHGICDVYMLHKTVLLDALHNFPIYAIEMRELALKRLRGIDEELERITPGGRRSDAHSRSSRRSFDATSQRASAVKNYSSPEPRVHLCKSTLPCPADPVEETSDEADIEPLGGAKYFAHSDQDASPTIATNTNADTAPSTDTATTTVTIDTDESNENLGNSSELLAHIYEDRLSQRMDQLLQNDEDPDADPWRELAGALMPMTLSSKVGSASAAACKSDKGTAPAQILSPVARHGMDGANDLTVLAEIAAATSHVQQALLMQGTQLTRILSFLHTDTNFAPLPLPEPKSTLHTESTSIVSCSVEDSSGRDGDIPGPGQCALPPPPSSGRPAGRKAGLKRKDTAAFGVLGRHTRIAPPSLLASDGYGVTQLPSKSLSSNLDLGSALLEESEEEEEEEEDAVEP
eukprot:COSAG05_NODE_2016_length_3693_cov_2.028659_1_plen_1040_part_00